MASNISENLLAVDEELVLVKLAGVVGNRTNDIISSILLQSIEKHTKLRQLMVWHSEVCCSFRYIPAAVLLSILTVRLELRQAEHFG